MTIRTHHFALRDLGRDGFPPHAIADHVAHVADLHAAHVVEFEDHRIALATIGARSYPEVVIQLVLVLGTDSLVARRNHLDVSRSVLAVVLPASLCIAV